MKKIVFYFLFAAVVAVAQVKGPVIFVPSDTYDFGTINAGEMVKHRFIVVNNGDDVLNITGVITSCGCTAANPEKDRLAPGESTTIAIEFNSTGRVGQQTKYISIGSNDNAHPQVKLTLKGNIVVPQSSAPELAAGPNIEVTENQYDFGVVKEGELLVHVFKFKNTGNADLDVMDVKTSCGCTAAILSANLLKPGEEGSLKIEFDTANRFGRVSRTITISSNDQKNSPKVLTIYAEIVKKEG